MDAHERRIKAILAEGSADGEPPLPEIRRRVRERTALRELIHLGSRFWIALIVLIGGAPTEREADDG